MDSEIQDNYLKIYRNDYSDDGYFLDESYNHDQLYSIVAGSGYEFSDRKRIDFENFTNLLRRKKIKVLKKPSYLGWFYGNSINDDLSYTFDQYEKKLDAIREKERQRFSRLKTRTSKKPSRREDPFPKNPEIVPPKTGTNDESSLSDFDKLLDQHIASLPPTDFTIIANFKKDFPKITNILKRFVMENEFQLDDLLKDLLFVEKKSESEVYDLLIQEARRKYNFEKDQYNERVKKFSQLSLGEKEKTKSMGKNLDKFLLNLKPLIQDYDSKKRSKDEFLKQQILENEKREAEKSAQKLADEKKKQLQLANEQIEDLEYKIRDAESKYSMKKAKLNKLKSRIFKLEQLKKQKSILEEKIKNKNLKILERKNLLETKSKIDNSLKNLDSLKSQLADLKSKIPDLSVFEQEKLLRQQEIENLKKLNESSIRQKNANLRSLELEKKREEIRILEEERYQQQKLQEEELKQAKIVFLKEKKLANKRIDQLKWEVKSKNIKLQNLKKLNSDLEDQKKKLKRILFEKKSSLRDKQSEIAKQKILNLESQKAKIESQQLFTESLKLDIDDLNFQKEILKNISDKNKKILQNTKREISNRQKEIEKTISLNMENEKISANESYAKISQLKLDVFQTLSEVKNQAALKTDVENTLEDLKDSILRKEAVENLLSDTIDNIVNNEISEIENYNSYLESEISFKKKLANENFTFAEKQEFLNEEKEDLIERLEHTKSKKLKKIYELREKAIEQQMKILLIEGADELKNEVFSLKFDIQNLENQKEISERKEDLFRFQADNAKRELKLRKQEIELLKNIRIKVLETQRINERNEARIAIQDMIKTAEKNERDSAVREKMTEILDDVESKEISENTKKTLYSLIDKISNKEIHDSAKFKLSQILVKIELHDNIDESRKTLSNILDEIENKEIRQEVQTKLDEILDDIEYDDYDFLEDDDLDILLKSVKNHISGEQKIEKFLPKIQEEDTKLKMDAENIELQNRNPPPEDAAGDVAETSFDEFSDYNFFINNIEDPFLKEKTRSFLSNIDAFEKEEEKIPKIKNAYKSAINDALWNYDKLDLDYWDGNLILDEQAKFKYEQKVNNINTALGPDYNIHIDPTDLKIREFLDIKLVETFSEKRGEINGYKFNGEKIISRNISRNFFFNYLKKPAACQKFIDELKEIINKSAKSQIVSESYFEGKSVKDCALEYIGELREEQSYQIDSARNSTEMRNALRNVNEIDDEIKNIKKNLPFKMRMKIFKRTLSWRFTKLLRLLWKHKGKVAGLVFGLFSLTIGITLNQLGFIAIVHNLKKAARSVHQYANDVHEMGKRIINNFKVLYGIPGKIGGFILIGIGLFLRLLYFFTRLSGTASSSWVFGIFGSLLEISFFFSSNMETINEKVSETLEETGNIIENQGIKAQKYIAKNAPRWYYDIPVEKRSILQHVEAAAINVSYKMAQGTQTTGKKVQEAGEIMSQSLFYLQAILVVSITLLFLSFIRNNLK